MCRGGGAAAWWPGYSGYRLQGFVLVFTDLCGAGFHRLFLYIFTDPSMLRASRVILRTQSSKNIDYKANNAESEWGTYPFELRWLKLWFRYRLHAKKKVLGIANSDDCSTVNISFSFSLPGSPSVWGRILQCTRLPCNSLNNSGLLWVCNPPSSPSQVLGSQEGASGHP